ncbi:melanoma-associated antigen B3 [Fukomys damarensis]|uniref:Melanoma-associated antigen B3 n=1 Tax=Fukomys damarensis TaxID=885580 RepID=A0A091DBY1_FUKDA|nr:melanoma-associated antigen B3 [Fukomys damarensis]KFO28587.1 Melanoma-associated antigen B3 [Fukomys damarensis]
MPPKKKRKLPAPKKHCPVQGETQILQKAPAPKKQYQGKGKTQVLQESPAPKKHCPSQGKTQVLQEGPAPKKHCPGKGKTQVLQEGPAPKKHCPGQGETQVHQEGPATKKHCPGKGKIQVLQKGPAPKKHCPGQGETQVHQEAQAPKKHRPVQGKTKVLQKSQVPKKHGPSQGKTQILQESQAPKKHGRVQRKTQVIQEAQAPATKKKILQSSSASPLVVTPGTDSDSHSQSSPEEAVSTAPATNKSNPRSDETTKRKKKKPALSKTVSTLVNYIIEMYKMKKTIRKKDMLMIINKKFKKHFPELLKRASFNIEVVFGMELKEVDATKHSYTLVGKMNLPYNGMLSRGRGFPKTGILMNLLGVIFMKGNSAPEEKIWEFLNKMKIYDGQRHFLFGEPRKLITRDLVQLKYLEHRQIPDSDPPQYEFLWGPRAYAETSKMKVLEFWAKINDITPTAFQSKYEEALKDEEEKADPIIIPSESSKDTKKKCSIPGVEILPTIIEVDEEEDS